MLLKEVCPSLQLKYYNNYRNVGMCVAIEAQSAQEEQVFLGKVKTIADDTNDAGWQEDSKKSVSSMHNTVVVPYMSVN